MLLARSRLTAVLFIAMLFVPRLVAQDTVTLAPVVVTATRVALPADALASAVTVITGAELRARGVRSLGEALRDVPGAAVVASGGFGGQTALFLRGGEADYVKVLLDGVPVNQPGGAVDFADLTTDNVERIEIVRGPASVLYGSDAMTGVIQVFTRAGAGAPRVAAEARAGTYGTSEAALEIAGGSGPVAYSARIARFGSSGIHAFNNDYRNVTGSGLLRYRPNEHGGVSLVYRYGDAVYHFPTDGAGRPVDSNQVSAERGPVVSLELERRLVPALELRVSGAWQESRVTFDDASDSAEEDGAFTSRDLVRRASAGAALHWRPSASSVITAGVEYEDQRQNGRSEFSASYGTFPDSVSVGRWNTGYYGQALLGTASPVSVTLGARLDQNSEFGRHTTVRAGGSYRLGDRTRLRAAAGTGFKEPTFYENFATGFVIGNPKLDPERSMSWEAGVEYELPAGRARIGVSYFHQRFRDLIEYSPTAVTPDSVNYFNVAGARAAGVEATIVAPFGPGGVVTVGYTYLTTRVREAGADGGADGLFRAGQPLIRRPEHVVSAQLLLPVASRVHTAITLRYVGARDDLDFARDPGERRVTLGGYVRADVAVEYHVTRDALGGAGLVLTARVDNLTNDATQEIRGFRVQGRTVLLGGRVVYGE